jgi:protein TonB
MKKLIFFLTLLIISTISYSQEPNTIEDGIETIEFNKLVIIYKPELNIIYPRQSKDIGEEGITTLRFEVETDGLVKVVSLKKSSGYDRLDKASLTFVKKIRVKPVLNEFGEPVKKSVEIMIKFSLP